MVALFFLAVRICFHYFYFLFLKVIQCESTVQSLQKRAGQTALSDWFINRS